MRPWNTFRSDRHGFQIDLPSGWSCSLLGRWFGRDGSLSFKSSTGFFQVKPGPPQFSGMSLAQIQGIVMDHAYKSGHLGLETGTIRVHGKDHLWARYMTTGEAALEIPASREIIRMTRAPYRDVVGSMSDALLLSESKAMGIGPIVKSYWLVYDRAVYDLTASLAFSTLPEAKQDKQRREAIYDGIVSMFSLVP